MSEQEGWIMCLKRAMSKLLLGRKIVEAKEQRDRETKAKVVELTERIERNEKDSLDVTQEIETLCATRQSSADWTREDD